MLLDGDQDSVQMVFPDVLQLDALKSMPVWSDLSESLPEHPRVHGVPMCSTVSYRRPPTTPLTPGVSSVQSVYS